MEEKQTGSIQDILKIVNRASNTFAFEVFVPSLQRNVLFKEITTNQQKKLLKAIIDSPAYNTEFIFALRQIIIENCTEDIKIDDLTIFDKLIIALNLRAMSISNDLDLQFTLPAKGNLPERQVVRRINIKDLITKTLGDVKISPIVIKDEKEVFEISCDLPTIADEFRLENELRQHNQIEIKNENDLRETVGTVFTNVIVKYIKSLKIKEQDKIIEINLKDLKFKDRLEIIEKLPVKITKQTIDYINSIQKEFDKIILIKDVIDDVSVEQRLKIDASFFTPS